MALMALIDQCARMQGRGAPATGVLSPPRVPRCTRKEGGFSRSGARPTVCRAGGDAMDAVVDLTEEAEEEDGGAGAAHAEEDQGDEEARLQQALATCAEELQSVEDSLLALSSRRDALRRKREGLAEQVCGGGGRRQVNTSTCGACVGCIHHAHASYRGGCLCAFSPPTPPATSHDIHR